MNASLFEIAALIQGVVVGDETLQVIALSPIDRVMDQALVFAEGADNLKLAEESNAIAILVGHNVT